MGGPLPCPGSTTTTSSISGPWSARAASPGEQAAARPAHGERAAQGLEESLGRSCSAPGPLAGAHRPGAGGLPLRGRDLQPGAGAAGHAEGPPVARAARWWWGCRTRWRSAWRTGCWTPRSSWTSRCSSSCRRRGPERLVAELAAHELDLVLSDTPAPSPVRAYSHLLGECGVGLFARPALARKLAPRVPEVDGRGAPADCDGRRRRCSARCAHWFETRGIRPRSVGEFQDGALMESFGEAGAGVFPAPEAVESEVRAAYRRRARRDAGGRARALLGAHGGAEAEAPGRGGDHRDRAHRAVRPTDGAGRELIPDPAGRSPLGTPDRVNARSEVSGTMREQRVMTRRGIRPRPNEVCGTAGTRCRSEVSGTSPGHVAWHVAWGEESRPPNEVSGTGRLARSPNGVSGAFRRERRCPAPPRRCLFAERGVGPNEVSGTFPGHLPGGVAGNEVSGTSAAGTSPAERGVRNEVSGTFPGGFPERGVRTRRPERGVWHLPGRFPRTRCPNEVSRTRCLAPPRQRLPGRHPPRHCPFAEARETPVCSWSKPITLGVARRRGSDRAARPSTPAVPGADSACPGQFRGPDS